MKTSNFQAKVSILLFLLIVLLQSLVKSKEINHPVLAIKSIAGRISPNNVKIGPSQRKSEPWGVENDPKHEVSSTGVVHENEHKNQDENGAISEKSDSFMKALTLSTPTLFLPALLLALLYLIWAGSYSSYNYHNNYPGSYGVMGGPAVGFGHYGNGNGGFRNPHQKGNGLQGGTPPPLLGWRKTDRKGNTGFTTATEDLDAKIAQSTSYVLSSIDSQKNSLNKDKPQNML